MGVCFCVSVFEYTESKRVVINMNDLPVGFRFYPTEVELVSFYLPHKLNGTRSDIDRVIPVVNIYDYNPWDLPRKFI